MRAADGSMVPLSALVRIETDAAPAAIEQFNQLNSATLSALPLPGVTTSEGLATLRQIGREIMPQGFYEDYAGQSRLEVQEGSSIALAFGLAIIVIYLVLAAQFESFRDPFIIMMSVPLSMFGAMIFLNLGLATLNIYTEVGLITLVGLITKHGILMVEFANDYKEKHGSQQSEGDRGGGAGSLASDPHDDGRHGARRCAAALRSRRWCGRALLDGSGDRVGHVDRHDLHALRGADVLHLHLADRRRSSREAKEEPLAQPRAWAAE